MTGAELAIGFTMLSGTLSAVGQLQQGFASAQAADYNAAVSRRNAAIARQQAAAEEADKRHQANLALHQIRAAVGGSGFDMTGSPLDVLMDSAVEFELGAKKETYKGQLRALENTDKASLFEMQSDNAVLAGYLGAAGAVVKTASNYFYPGNSLLRAGANA